MNQSQSFTRKILGWIIPLVAAVVIAIALAPTAAQRLNIPLPTWLPSAQNSAILAKRTDVRAVAQNEAKPLAKDTDAWPTPSQDILAASGNVTPIVAVNFAESRVISEGDSCSNFICATDLDALQETVLPQGRPLRIESSRESGIMKQTAQLGVAYYESLLRSLGFDDVQVIIRSK